MYIDNLIGTNETEEILGKTPEGVQWLLRRGKLIGRKLGRAWVIDKKSVLAYQQGIELPDAEDRRKQLGNIIGTSEVSTMLAMTREGVHRLLHNKQLSGRKLGTRTWAIDKPSVLCYQEKRKRRLQEQLSRLIAK
jgi:hypothetical protein